MIATSSQNWHDYRFIPDWIYTGKKYHPQYFWKKSILCLFCGCRYEHVGNDVIHKNNAIKAKTFSKKCYNTEWIPEQEEFFAGMIIFKLAGWARRAEFISQIKHFNCRPKSFCSYLFLKVLMNFKPSQFWINIAVQNSYFYSDSKIRPLFLYLIYK